MTEEWWANLYVKAGDDMMEARVQQLLNEFKYLGSETREKKKQSEDQASSSAVGDEAC